MEELSVEKRNWSELPNHLLDIIMDKLSSSPQLLSDYIRFGAVCDSWNSAFCDHDHSHHFPPLLLMVSPPPPIYNQNTLRRFYNISDENIDGSSWFKVRMPHYMHCRGSSHGWLITVDTNNSKFAVRLFNPLLSIPDGIEILLPSLKTFPITRDDDFHNYNYLQKAVLSANPLTNPTDYTVMAIYGSSSRLAFFKPGNKSWTSIRSPHIKGCKPGNFTDIIYCSGKFFVVNRDGAVVAVSDKGKGMIAKLVIQQRPPLSSDKIYSTKKYLIVDSSGRELFQVHRFMDINNDQAMYRTITCANTGFRVFKLKVIIGTGAKEEEYKWQEVKSLCGDSMFLGLNTSISIRASDYPGCKPNSIHYTYDSDDWNRWSLPVVSDIGIFNLEDGSFKRHLPIARENTSAPIWIQPSLPNKKRKSIFNLEDGSFKRHLPIAPKNTSAPIWIQPSLPDKKRRSSSS